MAYSDVLPVAAMNDVGNALSSHAIDPAKSGKTDSSRRFGADFNNLLSCELSVSVFLARKTAALPCGISMVLGIRSKKQVVWVAAWRVIAMMAQSHSIWDFSSVKHPCRMGGASVFTLMRKPANYAVAILIFTSRPLPTSVSLIGVPIESLLKSHFSVSTLTAAIRLRASTQILPNGVKFCATA